MEENLLLIKIQPYYTGRLGRMEPEKGG